MQAFGTASLLALLLLDFSIHPALSLKNVATFTSVIGIRRARLASRVIDGYGPQIDEESRMRITAQLLQLRDDNLAETSFPASLSKNERVFVHKMADELGLKSKSYGKDENRYITVTSVKKPIQKRGPALFHMTDGTRDLLQRHFSHHKPLTALQVAESSAPSNRADTSEDVISAAFDSGRSRDYTASARAGRIESFYRTAQEKRVGL